MLPPPGSSLPTPLAPIPPATPSPPLVHPGDSDISGQEAYETLLVAFDNEGIMEKTLEERVEELEQEVRHLKKKIKKLKKKAAPSLPRKKRQVLLGD